MDAKRSNQHTRRKTPKKRAAKRKAKKRSAKVIDGIPVDILRERQRRGHMVKKAKVVSVDGVVENDQDSKGDDLVDKIKGKFQKGNYFKDVGLRDYNRFNPSEMLGELDYTLGADIPNSICEWHESEPFPHLFVDLLQLYGMNVKQVYAAWLGGGMDFSSDEKLWEDWTSYLTDIQIRMEKHYNLDELMENGPRHSRRTYAAAMKGFEVLGDKGAHKNYLMVRFGLGRRYLLSVDTLVSGPEEIEASAVNPNAVVETTNKNDIRPSISSALEEIIAGDKKAAILALSGIATYLVLSPSMWAAVGGFVSTAGEAMTEAASVITLEGLRTAGQYLGLLMGVVGGISYARNKLQPHALDYMVFRADSVPEWSENLQARLTHMASTHNIPQLTTAQARRVIQAERGRWKYVYTKGRQNKIPNVELHEDMRDGIKLLEEQEYAPSVESYTSLLLPSSTGSEET